MVTYPCKPKKNKFTELIILVIFLSGCSLGIGKTSIPSVSSYPGETAEAISNTESAPVDSQPLREVNVKIIPLAGPIADPKAEISGLTWYGDELFLLPQFPDRFSQSLFKLNKSDIVSFIRGEATDPLLPEQVQMENAGPFQQIKGFEGYESITFKENQVFFTIESKPKEMLGYLVHGTYSAAENKIYMAPDLVEILPQAPIDNLSDEAILIFMDKIITFYEANGANVNESPVAHTFSMLGEPLDPIPFPNIEYRITDVSAPDNQGRFWAINYFFPFDQMKLHPAADLLAEKYGRGPSHSQNRAVERLVEFQITDHGVVLLDTACACPTR